MTDPAAGRIERIAAAIAEYLARHPNARDSARGIRDCWLPEALQGAPMEEVERALEMLVEDGRVETIAVLRNPTLFTRGTSPSSPPHKPRPRNSRN